MRLLFVWTVAMTLGFSSPAFAGQGNGKSAGKGHGNSGFTEQVYTDQATIGMITVTERTIIDGYFTPYRGGSVPELGDAKPLPPGIAKKIARGGSLPPGIAKRYLPNSLVAQLPPRPGQQWLVCGTSVVLIDVATRVVIDVLEDIL